MTHVLITPILKPCFPKNVDIANIHHLDDDEEGEEGEEAEEKMPSCGDYIMHFLTLPWKLIFALIPPTGKSPTRYRHTKNANSNGRNYIQFYFYSQISLSSSLSSVSTHLMNSQSGT